MPPDAARIGIWGLGREGRSAARHFASTAPERPVTLLTDDAGAERPSWAGDAEFLAGEAAGAAIAAGTFGLLVKSPGISLTRPEISAAQSRGTVLTSCTNLWFERYRPRNVVAVSGTKGKSTTSTMLFHILRAEGLEGALLGNGGTPTLDEAPGRDFTVLEISSYQAADLAHAPSMAVLTNLYPEHMPWHGSLEAYFTAKLRLASLDPSIPAVADWNDPELRARLRARANMHWYNAPAGFAAGDVGLTFDGDPVAVEGTLPPGRHNLSNLAAAASAAWLNGWLKDPRRLSLGAFAALPHRLEAFALPGGVLAVDDSISTVPEATIAALDAYRGRPVHLILGGSDRGQDYGSLAGFLSRQPPVAAYLLPATGERIGETFRQAGLDFPIHACADLEVAVRAIAAAARPGDVVVLSPAAPSFGQFTDFIERGNHFRRLCELTFAGRAPADA